MEIRKIVAFEEETLVEGFRRADRPWRLFAVAAVITNPWAGRYVEQLSEEILAFGPQLGGRPHHRIGDRYQDLKALGRDVDNPAGV